MILFPESRRIICQLCIYTKSHRYCFHVIHIKNTSGKFFLRLCIEHHSGNSGKYVMKILQVNITFLMKTRNHDRFFIALLHSIIGSSKHIWNKDKCRIFVLVLSDVLIKIRTVDHLTYKRLFFLRSKRHITVHQLQIDLVKGMYIPFAHLKAKHRNPTALKSLTRPVIVAVPIRVKLFHAGR